MVADVVVSGWGALTRQSATAGLVGQDEGKAGAILIFLFLLRAFGLLW